MIELGPPIWEQSLSPRTAREVLESCHCTDTLNSITHVTEGFFFPSAEMYCLFSHRSLFLKIIRVHALLMFVTCEVINVGFCPFS